MADKINFAMSFVNTEFPFIMNDEMEVKFPGWVDALIRLAQRPTSGIFGARLLYPDVTIQHCGMVFGIKHHVAHNFIASSMLSSVTTAIQLSCETDLQ